MLNAFTLIVILLDRFLSQGCMIEMKFKPIKCKSEIFNSDTHIDDYSDKEVVAKGFVAIRFSQYGTETICLEKFLAEDRENENDYN